MTNPPAVTACAKKAAAEAPVGQMAVEHRQMMVNQFRNAVRPDPQFSTWLYLQGNSTTTRKFSDTEEPFRQESNFWYATGVQIPDMHVLVEVPETATTPATTLLVTPEYPDDHTLWCGPPFTHAQLAEKLPGTEPVHWATATARVQRNEKTVRVFALKGADTTALRNALGNVTIIEDGKLDEALAEARVLKTSSEVALMRAAAAASSEAHCELMRTQKTCKDESELEARFAFECARRGGRFLAYPSIVAGGRNAAVLHYSCNSAPLPPADGPAMVLIDAGCEILGYASDITRCFPRNGRFEGHHAAVYAAVLDANERVIERLRPGVEWADMHVLALGVIAEHLISMKLVHSPDAALDTSATVKALVERGIPDLFFPHGLGHLLGLNVHDAGGYPAGVPRFASGSLRYLRMRRTLEAGMVVTVEPGLYFVAALLEPAFKDPAVAPLLNEPLIRTFMAEVGGVRIEDDVLITTTGCDNLTAGVPKRMAEVEAVMRGGESKP